ncbi:MAG TPA: hypothetical protein VFT74_12145, partial [Isosphaeraceae bacterium]|nr:hypothetical protein [Isosphaeraceae bacterium]
RRGSGPPDRPTRRTPILKTSRPGGSAPRHGFDAPGGEGVGFGFRGGTPGLAGSAALELRTRALLGGKVPGPGDSETAEPVPWG